MNRVVYRTTLDVLKGGVQKTLQGFHVGDNLGRLIVLTLTSGADTFELPENGIAAIMYVIHEDGTQSINDCSIVDNVISYEVLPTDVPAEGIVKMQLKIIANNAHGIERVLFAPVFAIEVEDSIGTDDIEDNPTFTALENALAKAQVAYRRSVSKVELGADCILRITYADGTVYENGDFKREMDRIVTAAESSEEAERKAKEYMESALSSMYRAITEANTALSASDTARGYYEEVMKRTVYTEFEINWDNGHLTYASENYTFHIDPDTGQLVWIGVGQDIFIRLENDVEKLKDGVIKCSAALDATNKRIDDFKTEADQKESVIYGEISAARRDAEQAVLAANRRIDNVNADLDAINLKTTSLEQEQHEIREDISKLESATNNIKQKQAETNRKVSELETSSNTLKEDLKDVKNLQGGIKWSVENGILYAEFEEGA